LLRGNANKNPEPPLRRTHTFGAFHRD